MTTDVKVTWEEIKSLETLKLGDELEYVSTGENREFKYWGKVIDIRKNNRDETSVVAMEGDWTLLPSTLKVPGAKVTRKVVEFGWPDYIGACVEATWTGENLVFHYVRVAESGHNEWVVAETGEHYATWELDLISRNYTHRVISQE